MARRLVVNQDECISCGNCQEVCPEVFELDPTTDKSRPIKPEGGPACVEEAIDGCPVEAISWQED